METLDLLLGTLQLRPYVFAFLSAFLAIALAEIGPRRTLAWMVVGFGIAYACEWSSTRNGFPFGLYHYLDTTRDRELWISNVPFFDSLSFVFLSFVSWATARRLLGTPIDGSRIGGGPAVIGLAVVLMVAIDVVCDPLAVRGDQWFLGRIFYYASPGAFFGVPVTNFLGWAFVAFAIIGSMRALEAVGTLGGEDAAGTRPLYALPFAELLAPAFYAGIVLFNVSIALYLGLLPLALLGVAITAVVCALALRRVAPGVVQPRFEEAR